jgi:hypothetical protein
MLYINIEMNDVFPSGVNTGKAEKQLSLGKKCEIHTMKFAIASLIP